MGDHRRVKTCTAAETSTDDLHALLLGDLAALRVTGFAAEGLCRAVASVFDETAFGESAFGEYDASRYVIPAQRFGPTLNEHRVGGALSEDYWLARADAAAACERLPCLRELREFVPRRFAELFGRPVRPAKTAEGRMLHWGILRAIDQGTLPHWDDVRLEYPANLLSTTVTGQLAFNLFLTDAGEGGRTLVWDRRWAATDERHRRGFGYADDLLDDDEPAVVEPALGTAVLFNSRNYHRVEPCPPGTRRLSLSFFIAFTTAGSTVIWS
ncbi:2OG-Fe(II) oxygenase [Saccharothrix syringae]|uniref:2OG-Fe(II) oxygenase n=1 Tax=Saccharothrix syringae TaxID=103733 RepID=A0A5Q0GV58_SACSY|nr:2OG-Fe(II) oxygenase [Saccharothrix syringae]QFZ17384.1 2OG-Fe(II) oxygenase [Saccharothrix syringae]